MMRAKKACYTDGQLDELAEGRESLTPEEVASLDISIDDRYWALSAAMSKEQNRRVARRIEMDVIHLWDAPPIVKQYLETGDESLRSAAWDAARDAASAAAWAAAWDAASAAAWAAAWDAARDASAAASEKYLSWMVEELS